MGISNHLARRSYQIHRPAVQMGDIKARALRVRALIHDRRRLAAAFRRTQDESDRAQLENIDRELIKHNIDIPAVQQQVAMRKRGVRDAG